MDIEVVLGYMFSKLERRLILGGEDGGESSYHLRVTLLHSITRSNSAVLGFWRCLRAGEGVSGFFCLHSLFGLRACLRAEVGVRVRSVSHARCEGRGQKMILDA